MAAKCKTCELDPELKEQIDHMLKSMSVRDVHEFIMNEKKLNISYPSLLRHSRNHLGQERKWNFEAEKSEEAPKPDLKPEIFRIPVQELRERLNIPTSYESGEQFKKIYSNIVMKLWSDQVAIIKHYQDLVRQGKGKIPPDERKFLNELTGMLQGIGKIDHKEIDKVHGRFDKETDEIELLLIISGKAWVNEQGNWEWKPEKETEETEETDTTDWSEWESDGYS